MSNSLIAAFSATKILLPVDFSSSSEAALEAATGLAQQFHAVIHLVHIVPEFPNFNGSGFLTEPSVLQERKDAIEEKLDSRKQQLIRIGVPASFSIEEGNDIVGGLMRVIKRENADMVVISTHGLSGWRPVIFGSIAEQVIKHVNCTLLLLQPGQHGSTAEVPPIEARDNSFIPHVEETHVGSAAAQPGSLAYKRLEQVADDMAERAGRTEQHYDQAHSLFTK